MLAKSTACQASLQYSILSCAQSPAGHVSYFWQQAHFLLYNLCSMRTCDRASHSDTAKLCLIACGTVQSKSRRRAGRPITYKDNPDAKNLTEGERRKVKRRIANRESARRVRARRAETLEELQIKVRPVSAHLRLIMT